MIKALIIIASLITAVILGGVLSLQADNELADQVFDSDKTEGNMDSKGNDGGFVEIPKDENGVYYLPADDGKFILIPPAKEGSGGNTIVYVNSGGGCCPSTCTTTCPSGGPDLTFDPVCASDGKTYINANAAEMAGVSVMYKGQCSTFKPLPEPDKTPETSELCKDTDGGDNPVVKGTVTLGEYSVTDKCQNIVDEIGGVRGRLTEYFCKAGDVDSKEYVCEGACGNGACTVVDDQEDTPEDSGTELDIFNPYTGSGQPDVLNIEGCIDYKNGQVDFYSKDYIVVDGQTQYDSCKDASTLEEVRCADPAEEGGKWAVQEVECSAGCYDGACAEGPVNEKTEYILS